MSSSSSSPPLPPGNPLAALSVGKSFKTKTVDLTVEDEGLKGRRKHKKEKTRKHSRHRGEESPYSRKQHHHHHHKKRRRSSSVSSSASEPTRDRRPEVRASSGEVTFNVGSFEFFADSIGSAFGNGKCFRPEVPPILKRLVNSGGRRDGLRDAPVRYYDKKATVVVNAASTDHWGPAARGKCEMPGVDDAFLGMADPKAQEEEKEGGHDGDGVGDDRDLTVALGELETENRRLVQACRSHPERVENWMGFIHHQKKWMASLGIDKGSIEEKIRTILEDAVTSSPGTPRLWQLRLLEHPSPNRKQDQTLWTRAMREPAVASALASSCVQSFLDSGDAQSEDLGRDPEALLDALIRSGVLSSLTMEVVYDILCRVALCDMDRAIMLFRGVVTRALFRKMSPLIGTPSAHYALVGQDIMNVNPGYLGICESIDAASPSTPDDIDVEHSLGVALENFPESPVLGWVAKEFSLEVPQTPRQELSQADAHLVGRLARDLTKRDGMELVLRLVDILCGASMNSLQRFSCRHPYRLVFHGYFGDPEQLPIVSGYARLLAARCLAHALLACTAADIDESLLLRELIVAAEPSTGRAVVATSTASVRLWSAYAMTQTKEAPSVTEKCIASFPQCLPLKAGWAFHKLVNGSDLSGAVECIVDGSSNVAIASRLEELRDSLPSAERTDPPSIGLPSTFTATIWCIWLLGVAKNPGHPEKPLAEFWRLLPSPTASAVGDMSNRAMEVVCKWLIDAMRSISVPPMLMRDACLRASTMFPGRPELLPQDLPTRELWRLQPIGREAAASAALGVHSRALHATITSSYASAKLPTASLEVANVLQATDRASAERHCLAALGRLSMPHRGLWAIRVALIDSSVIDFEDKVVDVVCAMAEAGIEPRSDIVEWLAAIEGRDEG